MMTGLGNMKRNTDETILAYLSTYVNNEIT
jgi:hypothetical protein